MVSPEVSTKSTAGQIAYLVLGMHRSGTSAMTQLLAYAGADLPNHVMGGDEYNEKGYFEPWRIAVFNDERLRAAGSAWDDPFTDPNADLADAESWRARALALFQDEYRRARAPLLKDPRVSVLLPLWRTILTAEKLQPHCVIPVRHPLAVAGSLAKRDGFPVLKSVLLWRTYMVEAERGTQDLPRAFVDYDAMLTDWRPVVKAMEDRLGSPLPKLTQRSAAAIDAFLTTDLRHNKPDDSLLTYGEIGHAAQGVHQWLISASRGEEPDLAPMTAAVNLIGRLRKEIGALVSPVTSSNNLARAELADARARLNLMKQQLADKEALVQDRNALVRDWEALVGDLEASLDEELRSHGAMTVKPLRA